ncbi:MAG TPA: dockerin type I domain-containing protein [Candidatus Saccharimonadales bacterium]|nr:dockerin type I domain-containing protein [Candidatus Saccharimonadales bacterium]
MALKTKISPLSRFSHSQLIVFALFFALVGGFLLYKSFALNPNLPGDVNNDNTVNITDLSILLSNYNTNYPAADFNSDGTVSILDLSVLLSNYGRSYAGTPQPVTNQRQTGSTATSITMSWDSPSSGPVVAGYDAYLNSNKVASLGASATSYTYNNLTCGTTYTVGLVTKDAAGNGSDITMSQGPMSTASCTTPPPAPPPPPSGGGGTPVIWMSPSGSDSTCVRGDSGKPCLTINKARSIAQCGDTVSVAGGSYGSQSVSGGPNCSTNPVIFKTSGSVSFGSITLNVAGIRLDGITSASRMNLNSSCNGCQVYNATIQSFTSHGADNVSFVNNNIGPATPTCNVAQNFLWSASDTDGSSGWLLQGNTFHDFQCDNPHSEALYIANRAGPGLIENNIFTNNGSTSHIFWTWYNDQGSGCTAYGQNNGSPHDWCTRNNTFYDTWDAYYAINIREELELSGNPNHLYIDNHQTVTGPVIPPGAGGGSNLAQFITDWGKFMLVSSCSDPR